MQQFVYIRSFFCNISPGAYRTSNGDHSDLRPFTGLAIVALMICKLTVSKVSSRTPAPVYRPARYFPAGSAFPLKCVKKE